MVFPKLKNDLRYHIIPALILLLILITFSSRIISKPGIILYGDFLAAYSVERFLNASYPLWNQYGSFPTFEQLSRIIYRFPLYYILKLFGAGNPEIYFKIIFLGTLYFAGISIYCLIIELLKEKNVISVLIAIFSAIFYMFNPWAIQRMHQQALLLGYGLTPLIFLFCYKMKGEFKLKYIIIVSFLLTLSAVTPHYFVLNSIVVFLWFIYNIFLKHPLRRGIKLGILMILIYTIFVLLSSYWILPLILSKASPNYASSKEIVDVVSRNSDILNVLMLVSTWFVRTPYKPSEYLPLILWSFCGIILIATAFSAIILSKKNKIAFFFTLLALLIVLLAMGSKGIRSFYYWIVFDIPLGWIFRGPNKCVGLLVFSYGVLIVFFVRELLSFEITKQKILLQYIIIGSLFLSFGIYAYPNAHGFFNKVYLPVRVPQEIFSTYDYLHKTNAKKALYLSLAHPFKIRLFEWGKVAILDTISSPIPSFSTFSPYPNFYFLFAYDGLLLKDLTNNFGKYLVPMGVDHLIYHNATVNYWYYPIFPGAEENIRREKLERGKIVEALNHQKDLHFAQKFGDMSIFKSLNFTNDIRVCPKVILLNGGIEHLESLYNLDFFTPSYIAISLLDQEHISMDNYGILITDNKEIIPIDQGIKITPVNYTVTHSLNEGWARGFVVEPAYGEWHRGPLSKLKFENWQFDYDKGIVYAQIFSTLVNLFKVNKSNNYKLFIRYFENQKGGTIKIYLDDNPIDLKTKSQLNKFVWKDLGTFYMKKGRYKIVLENVEGFNAVNLFALIPEEEYNKAKQKVERLLQNKTIIYLLEAESDLYRGNIKVPDVIFENGCLLGTPKIINNPDLSNGEALEFNADGKAWQSVDIIKEGYYRIGARLEEKFEIKIGDYIFDVHSPSLDLKYTPPFYLRKGKYYLQILPKGYKPILDTVYLYSVNDKNSEATLEDIFKTKDFPAEVKNYKKINPTLWKVKVNAKRPFMLSFAEAYDPLWEARIYKNGEKIEKVKSIPLYSVINGFWIDQTGDLEIVIRYKPQDWFEIGLVISALTFIGCIGYLFYDWRKNRKVGSQ